MYFAYQTISNNCFAVEILSLPLVHSIMQTQ